MAKPKEKKPSRRGTNQAFLDNQWKKGQVINPGGRPRMPEELRVASAMRINEFKEIIFKYWDFSSSDIEALLREKTTPGGKSGNLLPMKEVCVLKIMNDAAQNGDTNKLNYLLDRAIGKVPNIIEVGETGSNQKLHDDIMNDLENYGSGKSIMEK